MKTALIVIAHILGIIIMGLATASMSGGIQ